MTDTRSLARSPAVWVLGFGQTIGYAALFYIFAALIVSWRSDLGWDDELLAFGAMIASVLAAVLAPVMGGLVDRGKSLMLMTFGPVAGALSLGLLALAQTPFTYLAAWTAIGVSQSLFLYEVTFAFLIRRLGKDARAAIVRITLVAGFASTLSFPAGATLSAAYGWRIAVWIAAGAVLILAPLNYWASNRLRKGDVIEADRPSSKGAARKALRKPAFWLLAGVFSIMGLNHWIMVSYAVPIFTDLGATSKTAVFAASCFGPAQVMGRIGLLRFEAKLTNRMVTLGTMAVMASASAVLLLAQVSPAIVILYPLMQGAAGGIVTILKPMLVSETLGPEGYGTVAGLIQLPANFAAAIAPVISAAILTGAGVWAVLATSLALTVITFLIAWRTRLAA